MKFAGFTTGDEPMQEQPQIEVIQVDPEPVPKRQKSIPELYPEYKFIPAETALTRRTRPYKFPLFWLAVPFVALTGFFANVKKLRKLSPTLSYIQKYRFKRYLFIVDQNRKWGLIKRNYLKLYIAPQFDSMKWYKKNQILEVTKGREIFLVDIHGNKCV